MSMAATSQFSEEQRKVYVELAAKKGRQAAAKAAGVSTHTVSAWAKAAGVKFSGGPKAAARKKRGKKKVAAKPNGKANGHRTPAVGMPATSAGLDSVHDQLSKALAGVTAMRAAFRQVFG